DAHQQLRPAPAAHAYVPRADGLLQPHSGGKLGVESVVLCSHSRPNAPAAGGIEHHDSDLDSGHRGTHLCDPFGRLAGAAAFAAHDRRRCGATPPQAGRDGRRRLDIIRQSTRSVEEEGALIIRRKGLVAAGIVTAGALALLYAQERPTFRIKVDMVVLSFTVTDSKGHYVNGLKPADFRITEDGIREKINTFTEGNRPPMQVMPDGSTRPLSAADAPVEAKSDTHADSFTGTNVFVLFDTSNYMYRGFVFA